MRAVLIALLIGAAVASPAFAQLQAAKLATPAADARALAEIAVPGELYVPREIETARRALLGVLAQDPDMAELEAEHPGLSKAIWAAVEPEARKYAEAELPDYRALLAGIYQRRLSIEETRGIREFYATPTGRKILRTMYAPPNVDRLIGDIVRDPEGKISQKTADTMDRAKRAEVESAMTAEDAPALAALNRTISLAKLDSLANEVQRVTLDWANRSDPEFEAKIERLMIEVIERFVGKDIAR